MDKEYEQAWDLERLFPGGSGSQAFAAFMDQLEEQAGRLSRQVENAVPAAEPLLACLEPLQRLMMELHEASSFISCLTAQDMKDKKALALSGRLKSIEARFLTMQSAFDALLAAVDEQEWRRLPESRPDIAFNLNERRRLAQEKLPPDKEAIIHDLAVDGYHGWGDLYNTVVGQLRIPWEENGKRTELSAGQAANKLSHRSREVRAGMMQAWEQAWSDHADYFADALNRLAGFRLQVYKHRGWSSVLKEPLQLNRMTEETLEAMWAAVEEQKPLLVEYLNRKARLLGQESLHWADVEAPIGDTETVYPYNEACEFIAEQFGRFSPKMAEFARMALSSRWVEAEDRPGKRPGGFCTSFPVAGETRIFMTYAGNASNVATLAHELGHAYHQHVMRDMPAMAQDYAMNVAETASTFAEHLVSDAALKQARDDKERIVLLEDKAQRSVAFFMNLHARFRFELNFYEQRRKGLVGVQELSGLMEEAQKQAFHGALGGYHPAFWASKLHFYLTDVPFYNFPYTFGYLFSTGLYARAAAEGPSFENRYISLLRDTAGMTVEELALKHLGEDLRKPEFWRGAVGQSMEDVRQFLERTGGEMQ